MIPLDDARVRAAEAVFHSLLELPPEERAAALSAHCGSDLALRTFVEQLLRADEGAAEDVLDRIRFRPVREAPQRVGRYRIVGRIGEGGMGVVYEALQESPQRRVAIKLIRQGLTSGESVRRFRREAELLGQLEHPGIARIYEAGVADIDAPDWHQAQQPFLAMELVRGEPLTEYMTRSAIGLPAQLEVLARLCDIVQFAHQKGVIHRDLKPANIVVVDDEVGGTSGPGAERPNTKSPDDPRPHAPSTPQLKVLDFGVARAARAESENTRTADTAAGQLVGTLAYMSPEQLAGDPRAVDTRSDIYSLGVIAYELLCGQLPFKLSGQPLPQAIRCLAENEPPRPGSVRPELAGDVDAILLRALEKAPERRYPSAAEFAADLRRHLRHEPVLARPPSAYYQLRKFTRRNRALVAGMCFTLTALVAGLAGTATFAWREREQAARTQVAAARAQAVILFLREMLAAVDPQAARGREVTVRQVLDSAAERINSGELAGQPEVEEALRSTVGETYHSLGYAAAAVPHLRAALELAERLHHPPDEVIARTLELAAALDESGESEEAERLHRAALDAARRLHGEEHAMVARAWSELGVCLRERYELEAAEECHAKALALRRRLPDTTPEDVALCLSNLAGVFMLTGRGLESEPMLREALEIRRRELPGDHPDVASSANGLAVLLQQLDRPSEAEPLYRESLDVYRRVLEPEHPDLALTLTNYGALHSELGRTAEAVPLLKEALRIRLALHRPDDLAVANVRLHLAVALNDVGDLDAAAEEGGLALDAVRKAFGDRHTNTAGALRRVASMFLKSGDPAAAEPLLREALDILDHWDGPDRMYSADVRATLGGTLIELDRCPEAIEFLETALEQWQTASNEQPGQVGRALTDLAVAQLHSGDPIGAAEHARAALPRLRADGASAASLATCLLVTVEASLSHDVPFDDQDAEAALVEAHELRMSEFPEARIMSAEVERVRGLYLTKLGRFAEAEVALRCAWDTLATRESNAEAVAGRRTAAAFVALHEAWQADDPTGGHAARAAAWRATVEQSAAAASVVP